MNEYKPPEAALAPTFSQSRVPIFTYIMAVVSGMFVTFGVMFLAAFSHLLVGNLLVSAPKFVQTAIPFAAIGLGLLTVWQTIRKERLKGIDRAKVGKP